MNSALWFGSLIAVVACSGGDDAPAPDAAPAATVVYVVRHAETTGTGTDPVLSTAGQARAQALATRLESAQVTAIYTSQYLRTHDTAVPLAAAAGVTIDVRTVDGTNAATYGTELATAVTTGSAKAVLIVGHSNTVPDTVQALSGTTVPAIAETEYDRLYTITLVEGAAPTLDAATYGP